MLQGNKIGNNQPINDLPVEDLEAFYGTQAFEEVKELFSWATGKEIQEALLDVFQMALGNKNIEVYADILSDRFYLIQIINKIVAQLEILRESKK